MESMGCQKLSVDRLVFLIVKKMTLEISVIFVSIIIFENSREMGFTIPR